jgi:phage terminase large subunit
LKRAFPPSEIKRALSRSTQTAATKRGRLSPQEQARYQLDPVAYAEEVLGADLTADQKVVLRSLVAPTEDDPRRVLVMASHAIGKTYVAAIAACWWYDCWDQHIVYITAPTWPQALGLTFKEIRRQRRAAGLPGRVLRTGLVLDEDEDLEPGHFIRAINAAKGEGFQGEHTADVLVIIEEGVGVPAYIWEAADGLMTTPGCRLLTIGNPTDESGNFGMAAQSDLYRVMSISALEHPNIVAEIKGAPAPYPRAVRLKWLYEMLRKECDVVTDLTADHFEWYALAEIKRALQGKPANLSKKQIYRPNAIFQGRVLGMFPSAPDEQVIPRSWLRRPVGDTLEPYGVVELGVDVARFGTDRTVIMARQGPALIKCRELRQMNLEVVVGAIVQMANDLEFSVSPPQDPKAMLIKIDVTGGLGAGPCDRLLRLGYRVAGVNSSSVALDPETYPNRRSELWFSVRERAREKDIDYSRLEPDQRNVLEREWTTPKWKPDARGRKVVESKADIKKRNGGSSPDYADAANLAYYGVDADELEAEELIEEAFQW